MSFPHAQSLSAHLWVDPVDGTYRPLQVTWLCKRHHPTVGWAQFQRNGQASLLGTP